ncbi:MAG: hypothetical protein CMJ23_04015 [Phycisphaerae bacterium]|nr:hypothetical protein [Phycisphaerae bacterium]
MTTAAAISIGNTTIQAGNLVDGLLDATVSFPVDDASSLVAAINPWFTDVEPDHRSILIASVNRPAEEALRTLLADSIESEILEMERDLAAPIGRGLDPESTVGVDRLLAAAGAWEELNQACIVIDAGTAVTVDFVDGEGVFQGGAILPGVSAMLRTMAVSTDLLPDQAFEATTGEAWGRDTIGAMHRGVHAAVTGGAWKLVERYAMHYGGFPLVVATGGDAEMLFKDDELVSRVVPDLVLRGMALAWRTATGTTEDAEA